MFHYIQAGFRPSQLQERLAEEGIEVSREHVSRLVWQAVENRQLRFVPMTEDFHDEALRKAFRSRWGDKHGLRELRVVSAVTPGQTATSCGEVLLKIMEERWAELGQESEETTLRLGFAGGITCSLVIEELARLIKQRWMPRSFEPEKKVPRHLVFHALNGLLGNGNPAYNPTTYFPTFSKDFPLETVYHSFPAPGVVMESEWGMVKDLRAVREASQFKNGLDIVLISAGHWGKGHRTLADYVVESYLGSSVEGTSADRNRPGNVPGKRLAKEWEEEVSRLKQLGCVGDLFWQPLFKGPQIKASERKFRVTSLFDLDQIPEMIRKGTRVLLVLGPCSGCRCPKDEVLEAILGISPAPVITDLVVTTLTASAYLQDYLSPA